MAMLPKASAPTISQVAKAAGVSRSSVSRAFTQPQMLGEGTVRRILAAAAELGYVPNPTARALSTGRNANIALIIPDVANPFFPPLIQAVQNEADRSDFCVFLGNSSEESRHEDKLLDRLLGQVEGVILASSRMTEERIRAHALRRPLVLINREIKGLPSVLIDSGAGVRDAVAHLAQLGHRHLLYVSGPSSSWSNRQRRSEFERACAEHGLGAKTTASNVSSYAAGRAAVPVVLSSGVTAVIAFDDLMAQGILNGLDERGVCVPSDISIVGCDDVLGASTYPALTTVSNRSTEAGRTATSLLMEIIRSGRTTNIRHSLTTSLVLRATTATMLGKCTSPTPSAFKP